MGFTVHRPFSSLETFDGGHDNNTSASRVPLKSRAQWRKSSYSGNTGNCVAVADLVNVIAVRDSKDLSGGLE